MGFGVVDYGVVVWWCVVELSVMRYYVVGWLIYFIALVTCGKVKWGRWWLTYFRSISLVLVGWGGAWCGGLWCGGVRWS